MKDDANYPFAGGHFGLELDVATARFEGAELRKRFDQAFAALLRPHMTLAALLSKHYAARATLRVVKSEQTFEFDGLTMTVSSDVTAQAVGVCDGALMAGQTQAVSLGLHEAVDAFNTPSPVRSLGDALSHLPGLGGLLNGGVVGSGLLGDLSGDVLIVFDMSESHEIPFPFRDPASRR